jgi:predicted phosphodiesterase
MKIYVTGDTHGTMNVNSLAKMHNIWTEDDTLIVLGDFGICWDGGEHDNKVRNFWNRQKVGSVLFVDGNHENHALLNSLHVSEWCGGKVHQLGKKLIHLMRGQVYTINGKTILTFGGAGSIDCGTKLNKFIESKLSQYHTLDWDEIYRTYKGERVDYDYGGGRLPGKSWWYNEVPSPAEMSEAEANLAKIGNKVDYILSHTGSTRIHQHLGFNCNNPPWQAELMEFFDRLEENIEFDHWWFGHLHKDFVYDERHIGFYDSIRELI